jgi:NAD(P)-dependent dehydrogenase (short-subunit alcohol dehydrogenase family)
MDAAVLPGFTRLGSSVRRRLDRWRPIDSYDLSGRVVLVTGATSGLGRHTATTCARLGATVIVTGRGPDGVERAAAEIAADAETARAQVVPVAADMGEPDQVRRLAAAVGELGGGLDALVHNAGALSPRRHTNSAGIEATVASQVLGPFLLTALLLELLSDGRPGRVITVSSGGMYTAPLTVTGLQMPAEDYSGSEQYARAKRAQVTLNEMWAARLRSSEVVFSAMHPGWADTPGVRASLPRFRAMTRPVLRSIADGADTIEWLVCDAEPTHHSGAFWHDRRRRPIHRLASTRRSDAPERRRRLWNWCVATTGVEPQPGVRR